MKLRTVLMWLAIIMCMAFVLFALPGCQSRDVFDLINRPHSAPKG